MLQRALQGLHDAGGIAAVPGVVVGVTGVDEHRVRPVEPALLFPVGGMGQVALNEHIRVNGDAHGLQQHHAADALAAVHPAGGLVNIRGRNDLFHQFSSYSVKNSGFVIS